VGPKNNKGCPIPSIVPVEITQQLDFHSKHVQFKTSSAELMTQSYENLSNVLEILRSYPNEKFTIYGYTDNTGSADLNLKLSKKRADSVKNYFVKKGIDAFRLESGGFGEKNPITPNDSPEGRAKNRRVEIKLKK